MGIGDKRRQAVSAFFFNREVIDAAVKCIARRRRGFFQVISSAFIRHVRRKCNHIRYDRIGLRIFHTAGCDAADSNIIIRFGFSVLTDAEYR